MRLALIALPALALALSACDGGGDPVQQALRDASAERHAAALKTTEEQQRQTPAPAPVAPSADLALASALIADHEAAIATARSVLDQSQDPDLRRLAQTTLDTHTTELAELRAWQAGR
ncbi:DUF305 domain-containing protein [Brevundimonas halotolerans]|uniref:Uncharacterized protein (DUF305 family) n=1 Tax=Brevundimonas halotolerans TaxID=69670 RepID=A0A7W9A279_9CAUL|nr:DUF305 domain-containing protein [Brevundimonas halotolerans]MBB5659863.1 uncharacterized protein (DUF305 family) [Brevundimonas halotolerans]